MNKDATTKSITNSIFDCCFSGGKFIYTECLKNKFDVFGKLD